MSTEKLPEWPDREQFEPRRLHTCGERWEPREEREYNRAEYQMRLADAALARMEALVEVVGDLRLAARGERDYEVELDREVGELLAACARKEAGR